MSYTPPSGDNTWLDLSGEYTPPAGDQAAMVLGDEYVAVDGGCVLWLTYAERVDSGFPLVTAIASSEIESLCAVLTSISSGDIDGGALLVRAEMVEGVCQLVRGEARSITAVCSLVRGNAVPVDGGCVFSREWLVEVDTGWLLAVASVSTEIDGGCVLDCSHLDMTPIEVVFSLATLDGSQASALIETGLPTINLTGTVAGVQSPLVQTGTLGSLISLQLTASRDQYAVTGSMELADAAEYLACEHGADIEFTMAGKTVRLRVTDRRRSRSHGDWRYTIDLQSPAAWLDAPYADPVTDETMSGAASALATQLAAGVAAITWQTVDWTIPSDGLPSAGQTPLSLLRTLAAAPGAVLGSNWDGGLTVAPEYPLPITAWAGATPAIAISEAAEVVGAEDDDEWRGGYNAYLLTTSDPDAATGDLRIDTVDNDDGSKTIRAAAVPWNATLSLSHRGGSWVQLALAGDVWREETETVQIVDGEGRTQYPCRQVLATDWLEHELGAITASEDGLITSAATGDSLLSITYRTLARTWTMIDSRDEEVMVVAETGDQAAGAGVSVLVTRGTGDRRGQDVVDALLTSEAVARERGRNLIDAACSRRQFVTLTCPFEGLYEHGTVVEVREAADGPWRGMLRGQSVAIAVADDGTPTGDTVLTIERATV